MINWECIFADRMKHANASEIRNLLKLLEDKNIISFAGGIPNPDLFAAKEISEAASEIFSDSLLRNVALQYSSSEGYLPLRIWIQSYMRKWEVDVDIENILITSGSQQALDFLGKVFLSKNDTILVRQPTYLGALQAFTLYEPLFDILENIDQVQQLDDLYKKRSQENNSKLKLIYISSDFANPSGKTLTLKERQDLLDLSKKLNMVLIEDGAYQELRYSGDPIPSILSMDLKNCGGDIEKTSTVYCGSFSKTISPGLRVGWTVGNSKIINKLVLIKQASDLHTSTFNQILIHKIVEKIFDNQMQKLKSHYSNSLETMSKALESSLPNYIHWKKPEGGMFFWLKLPVGWDSTEIFIRLLNEYQVAYVPGSAFFPNYSQKNYLRLSYSNNNEDKIIEGIKRLGAFFNKEEQHQKKLENSFKMSVRDTVI